MVDAREEFWDSCCKRWEEVHISEGMHLTFAKDSEEFWGLGSWRFLGVFVFLTVHNVQCK